MKLLLPLTLTYLAGALSALSLAAHSLTPYILSSAAALLSAAAAIRRLRSATKNAYTAGHLDGWQAKTSCSAYEQQLHHQHYISHPKPYSPHEYDK